MNHKREQFPDLTQVSNTKMPDKTAAKKSMIDANVDFKAGKYASALEKYSKCIKLDPGEVTYPANRANVYIKMKKWSEAETDCTNALKIKPTHAKVCTSF